VKKEKEKEKQPDAKVRNPCLNPTLLRRNIIRGAHQHAACGRGFWCSDCSCVHTTTRNRVSVVKGGGCKATTTCNNLACTKNCRHEYLLINGGKAFFHRISCFGVRRGK
jgi:hypothetical protein